MTKDPLITKSQDDFDIEPIKDNVDTLAYLVNYENGWELLSADMRTDPVLITCDSGNIGIEELYSNPAQIAYMNNLMSDMKILAENPEPVTKANIPLRANSTPPMTYTDEDGNWWVYVGRELNYSENYFQDHLIETQWGQGENGIWNVCLPYKNQSKSQHCYAGCVVVAAAQVLHYLHSKIGVPAKSPVNSTCDKYIENDNLVLNSSDFTLGPETDCWDEMPLTQYQTGATDDDYRKVSSLFLKLGHGFKVKYTSGGAATSLPNMKNYLSSAYGIKCDIQTTRMDYSSFKKQIFSQKLPVVAAVTSTTIDNNTGAENTGKHAIIIDGYHQQIDHYTYTYRCGPPDTGIYRSKSILFAYQRIAINWGYDGRGQVDNVGTVWYNTDYNFVADGDYSRERIDSFDEYLYGFRK